MVSLTKNASVADNLAGVVVKALRNLISTIEKENAFLENKKNSQIKTLLDQKLRLIGQYDVALLDLEKYLAKADSDDISVKKKEEMTNWLTKLQEVSSQNEVLLNASLHINELMVDMYKQRQKEGVLQSFGYNKEGKNVAKNKLEKIMPSLSLNNRI